MYEGRGNLKLPLLRRVVPVLIFGIGCLLFSGPNVADEAASLSDHGYMLIRLKLTGGERVEFLAVSNVDTNHVIKVRGNSFESAGRNAWMALAEIPNGRYVFSEYKSTYRAAGSDGHSLATRLRRSDADSASDTFEIVPGAVNYVGDWTMRIDSARQVQLNPLVEFDKSTLERYLAQYPVYTNRYEIYLSAMGKEAISLGELVKTTE